MELNEDISKKIEKLIEKYESMGQPLDSYLDGLLISNYLTYWDYIQVDTLLTLQNPKTDFPDETIFIMYHQITELYFKLCLSEFHQIGNNGKKIMPNGHDRGWNENIDSKFLTQRITRINRYFEALTKSFDIMVDGMEKEQFLRFRMALLPASGFQSAQYRLIEIASTDLINLVAKDAREKFSMKENSIQDLLEHIYWKQGATELETGKKTLTLKQFETKYSEKFLAHANEYKNKNVWKKYKSLPEADQQNKDLIEAMKQLDINVNINWPLVHYKSAVRYLSNNNTDAPATGGTNWQKYLPPRFQKRIFFPELWSVTEKQEWGKSWVDNIKNAHN